MKASLLSSRLIQYLSNSIKTKQTLRRQCCLDTSSWEHSLGIWKWVCCIYHHSCSAHCTMTGLDVWKEQWLAVWLILLYERTASVCEGLQCIGPLSSTITGLLKRGTILICPEPTMHFSTSCSMTGSTIWHSPLVPYFSKFNHNLPVTTLHFARTKAEWAHTHTQVYGNNKFRTRPQLLMSGA